MPETTEPEPTVPETTEPEPTLPETTEQATTTTPRPTTTEQPTTTTTTLVPEEDLVVVVGNASDTYLLATDTMPTIQELGYVFVIRTDGVREMAATRVFFLDGYELEARRLARALGISLDRVEARPAEQLVEGNNADAHLLLLLGNDWEDATNLDEP